MCTYVALMSLTDSNGVTLTDEDTNSIFDADVDFDGDCLLFFPKLTFSPVGE